VTGWKCLRIVMDNPHTTIHFATTFIDNKYYCKLTRLACRANFHRLEDLKEHLEDSANRRCATEWLVQNFMYCIRGIREEQAETDDRSATPSAAEKQNSSSSGQRSRQPQQTTSPPPQPSLEDIRPRQNTTQEPVADVEALAEVISPGNELTVEDRLKHKEAMMAITESRSVWSLDLLLAREAHSDFGPFAGWVLVDCGVEPIRYTSFPRNTVWVRMKCPRNLSAEYRMKIGRYTGGMEHQSWGVLHSEGYSLRLEFVASESTFKENLPVSVIYGSGLSPEGTFRLGALRYDFMKRGWRISVVTSPPGQKIGGHWYESLEERPTDIEHPPTSTAAGERTVDSGQEGVESRNDLSRSADQQPDPETNLPSDPFAGWILCFGSSNWVFNYFYIDTKCPELLTGSWYFDFEDYISPAKYTRTPALFSRSEYRYRLECHDLPKTHDQSRIIPVDLLSYAPRLGDAYLKPSVHRFPLGHFKYDRGEGRWEFVQRSADR
jgi:hypothetical protein